MITVNKQTLKKKPDMKTIFERDGLVVSIDGNGVILATLNGQDLDLLLDLFSNEITSIESLFASKSLQNIKLAEAVKAKGKTHLLGARVSLSAQEAAQVEYEINHHVVNIMKAERLKEQLAEDAEYYKINDVIEKGYRK